MAAGGDYRVAGRERGAGGGGARPVASAAALACAPEGMAAGAARPIGRRLVGSRRPAAGPHRGDRVGERSPAAVAHAGVLHQRDLDEFAHVGRQIGGQRGGVSLMCFIATVSAPSPVNGRLPETAS